MKIVLSTFICSLILMSAQDHFVFKNGNQKISLKIDDGKRNIYWNKTSTISLKLENVEKEKVNISAPGIRYKNAQNKKDEINLEITPTKELFQNDSLKLNFSYHDSENIYVDHDFLILIK